MNYYVGLDLGTSSCKTGIFDNKGNLYGCVKKTYSTDYPKPGFAIQHEDEILNAVFSSCRESIADSGIAPEDIKAISFSLNAGGTMLVDENNRLIGGEIFGWQDARVLEIIAKTLYIFPKFYRITNLPFMPYIGPIGRVRWLWEKEPEKMKKIRRLCTFSDWLQVEFGAKEYVADTPSMCTLGFLDGNTRQYSPTMMKFGRIKEEQLPIVSNEPGKVVGRVSKEAAQKSGLPEGCLICLGAHDMDCICLGAGAVNDDDDPIMIVGTIGAFSYVSSKPVKTLNQSVISMPKQGQDKYLLRSINSTSAAALQWFADNLCNAKDGITDPAEKISFDAISKAAATSPIGSNNVTFCPDLVKSRGGFQGISLATNKSDMARAVMESVAFSIRQSMGIEKDIKRTSECIRLTGGAANSPFWCQMFADVLGRKIVTCESTEVGCLGAAIFATVGSREYQKLEEAVRAMVRVKDTYTPDKNKAAAYTKAYELWTARIKDIKKTKKEKNND